MGGPTVVSTTGTNPTRGSLSPTRTTRGLSTIKEEEESLSTTTTPRELGALRILEGGAESRQVRDVLERSVGSTTHSHSLQEETPSGQELVRWRLSTVVTGSGVSSRMNRISSRLPATQAARNSPNVPPGVTHRQ